MQPKLSAAHPSPRQFKPKATSGAKTRLSRLSSKTVFTGRVFQVTSERVKEPNGIVAVRDVVRHSGSVVILAVDNSRAAPRILLEYQYRYAAGQYMWEVPAGRIDPGERPLAGAKRELREETGYRAKKWTRALFFYPSPGFTDETMTVYLASELIAGKAHPEDDESIECKLTPLSQALEMIRSGKIRDGKTIISVLWLAQQR